MSRLPSIRDSSPPAEESCEDVARELINGIDLAADETCDDIENERPAKRTIQGNLRQRSHTKSSTNGTGQQQDDSVFKSANWLSDSELIFSLTNQVGGLVRALRVFQELDIGIKHVESRKSKRRDSDFEIFVDIDCSDKEKMRKLVHHLRYAPQSQGRFRFRVTGAQKWANRWAGEGSGAGVGITNY